MYIHTHIHSKKIFCIATCKYVTLRKGSCADSKCWLIWHCTNKGVYIFAMEYWWRLIVILWFAHPLQSLWAPIYQPGQTPKGLWSSYFVSCQFFQRLDWSVQWLQMSCRGLKGSWTSSTVLQKGHIQDQTQIRQEKVQLQSFKFLKVQDPIKPFQGLNKLRPHFWSGPVPTISSMLGHQDIPQWRCPEIGRQAQGLKS